MLVIYIKNLVIEAKHGVHPTEKTTSQPFNLNVEITLNDARAASSDNLNETVNWSTLRQTIITTVQNNSFALVERLAREVATTILTDKRVSQVMVSIDKLEAFETGVPGVRLVLEQTAD